MAEILSHPKHCVRASCGLRPQAAPQLALANLLWSSCSLLCATQTRGAFCLFCSLLHVGCSPQESVWRYSHGQQNLSSGSSLLCVQLLADRGTFFMLCGSPLGGEGYKMSRKRKLRITGGHGGGRCIGTAPVSTWQKWTSVLSDGLDTEYFRFPELRGLSRVYSPLPL